MAVAAMMATMTLTSCSKDDDDTGVVPRPEEQVVLNCAKPDYLKAGDRRCTETRRTGGAELRKARLSEGGRQGGDDFSLVLHAIRDH